MSRGRTSEHMRRGIEHEAAVGSGIGFLGTRRGHIRDLGATILLYH
jgi:hypothetical protein